jgi:Ca2+-transporting ATPase
MLQFWNMFNAKAFMTGKSAFHNLPGCKGFLLIAAVIFVGQILIVELGGAMFNVCHITLTDWLIIIGLTLPVLIIGELKRIRQH